MLYTSAVAAHRDDRIHLFDSREAASVGARDGRPVLQIALRFDPQGRRVTPLWVDSSAFDPAWWAPAELHADGSITARGPIPGPLILS